MRLTPLEIILIAVAVLLVLAIVTLWVRNRRSTALKHQFGPEYDRTVRTVRDEAQAEALLAERQKRVSRYDIKPLSNEMRNRTSSAVVRWSRNSTPPCTR